MHASSAGIRIAKSHRITEVGKDQAIHCQLRYACRGGALGWRLHSAVWIYKHGTRLPMCTEQ